MEPIGTVISAPGPSASRFSFVINEDAGSIPVRMNQFVMLDTEEGKMIARVSDIYKTNRYFVRAESVREYERSGKSMTEIFPAQRWEYLVGEAVPLGVYTGKSVGRAGFPPSPGTRVYIADNDILGDFLGFDREKGLNIGTVHHHNLDVKLNLTKLFQKHLAILAMSGAGKSYLTSVMIEELLERKPEDGQLAVIVIDTHGEYIGFAEDENYRDRVRVVRGKDFRIGVPGITSSLIADFIPEMSSVQERELNRILSEVKNEMKGKVYDLKTVADRIAEDERIKPSTRDVLLTILAQLQRTRLFSYSDNPSLDQIAKQGHLTVLDISDMTSLRKRQMVVTYLGRKLFSARSKNLIPPFLFIVEEAHNFAPEGVKQEQAISRGIIQKIAREGRKFHASLGLISQRPIQLSTTALSQCNTHIILRVTNPYDLDHIGRSSEGLTRDALDTISSLRVGEALIVGEAVNYPLFLKVRKRKSKKSERGIPLEEAAVKYYQEKLSRDEDVENFM
ncbi:MAG: hypothetical protein DRP11_05030 [Candidatus Aenigmatarchaeota archaeon]|nr:MAG: hypothetical protein DRP11_05030 [Candidatus Aenigmarchaeota archaeon]